MTHVTIVTGTAGAGKTERLLAALQSALEPARSRRCVGATVWLTPTRRIQKAITQLLTARGGTVWFTPNVLTFDLFAEKILLAAGRPATPISPVMKRLLLRRIAAGLLERGELRHFEPIAATTGFLDVVSSFISELKREEIWPDRFIAACEQRQSAFARRDLELGLIYDRYQFHLTEQNWYDNEGRFWLARSAIGDGIRGPFANVRFLCVDGFADFTQTQYEILGYLAGWIENITISLPTEDPLTRPDLFSKSEAAIGRIRKHLPPGTTIRIERIQTQDGAESKIHSRSPRQGWARSIGVIADRLFSNPHPHFCEPSPDASGLEVIAATGQLGEWELIACRIKHLLASGTAGEESRQRNPGSTTSVRPQDVVVGLRSISEDGPLLCHYLRSAGLPVWCEAPTPLTSSPIVKAVLSLLQCELEDWPFDRLMGVLDSTFFQPAWPEISSGQAARAVSAVLRRLRLNAGRDLILQVVGRYVNDGAARSASRADSLTSLARLALQLLARLSRTLDRLRRSHSLDDWADVLSTIAEDLGWAKTASTATEELTGVESNGLDLLQRILRTAAEADQKLAGKNQAKPLSLAEFTTELLDLLSHEAIHPESETGGCIRILSVEQIRSLDVPHLFLAGLTENSFPMNRADDCLFSEAERQDFIMRGIALRHRSSQHADELSLFYSVVTRARSSLTLSYPAVNLKGQPLFPSPYVTALTNLFSPSAVKITKAGSLDPVPSMDRVLTFSDLRIVAMDQAINGHPELFRSVMDVEQLRRASLNTLASCDVADQRFHQRGFTSYEGQLGQSRNLRGLRHKFGPHHQFSATELESYARCPFQFWLSTILKIEPMESPDEGTDYAGRGTLLHGILAKLLTEGILTDATSLPVRFRELITGQLEAQAAETKLQRALLKAEHATLMRWADAFSTQQSDYHQKISEVLEGIHSHAAEVPFGQLPDNPNDSQKSYPPIQFGRDERSVNLRGRIDRVDLGSCEGQPAYVVVDYKTGQPPKFADDDLISGRSIQLALYLVAIKRLGLVGPEAIPFQMGYWALQESGFKPAVGRGKVGGIPNEKLQWLEQVMDNLLPQMVEEIRSGRFVVENEDPNCTGRCPYRTVCRVNQIRPIAESLAKISPPRLNPDEISGRG